MQMHMFVEASTFKFQEVEIIEARALVQVTMVVVGSYKILSCAFLRMTSLALFFSVLLTMSPHAFVDATNTRMPCVEQEIGMTHKHSSKTFSVGMVSYDGLN
jgi:hypothetical protein